MLKASARGHAAKEVLQTVIKKARRTVLKCSGRHRRFAVWVRVCVAGRYALSAILGVVS